MEGFTRAFLAPLCFLGAHSEESTAVASGASMAVSVKPKDISSIYKKLLSDVYNGSIA